jgi:thiamine kinase-like enzyme
MWELWNQRCDILARIRKLPRVLSHGDYSLGNLIDTDPGVVALDWATVGWEPVGFDLAHLALSSGTDPVTAYLRAPRASDCDPELVIAGFRSTVALVGASRVHWMLTRTLEPPDWYTDFVWHHRPDP